MKVRTSVLRGFALLALSSLTFAACDRKETPIAPVPDPTIQVTPAVITLQVGQTGTFVASLQNAPAGSTVTWSSANQAVATVNQQGVVTAVTQGTATIIAELAGNPAVRAAGSVVVTAAPPSAVTLQLVPSAASVQVNGTVQLVSIVGGTTNQAVTYVSSAGSVATVSETGLVTGVTAGTAVITARTVADPAVAATSVITVTTGPTEDPITITITPTQATTTVNGTQQFVANVTGTGNTTVIWRSASEGVASIDENGLATAHAPGTAVITAIAAADTTRRVSATLTVTEGPAVTQPAISIQSVTRIGGAAPGAIAPGATITNNETVNVIVNVSAGSEAQIQRVEVRLGDTVACEQSFVPPLAATQGVQTISCVINPGQLDAEGQPLFPNGTYQLTAVAYNVAGAPVATAQWGTLVLNQTSRLDVTATTTPVTSEQGFIFVGGEAWNEGDVVVTARPVIFQAGTTIASATLCLDIPAANEAPGSESGTSCRAVSTMTDGAFTATFPKNRPVGSTATAGPGVEDVSNNFVRAYVSTTTTQTGAAGPNVPLASGFAFRLDNLAPGAPTTVDWTGGQWLGANFSFNRANVTTHSATALEALDPGANMTPRRGVGGVSLTFHVFAGTEAEYTALGTSVTARNAAVVAQGQQVTNSSDLAGTETPSEYILVVRTQDAVGNFVNTRVPGAFGVDRVAPQFDIVEDRMTGSPADQTINPVTIFQFEFPFVAGNVSGTILNPEVRIIRWRSNPAQTRCIHVNTGDDTAVPTAGCAFNVAAGTTVAVPAVDGYYQFTFRFRDNAGNLSATQTRTVLVDGTNPVVTMSTSFALAASTLNMGANITDNIDIRSWDTRLEFAGAAAPTGATSSALPTRVPTIVGSFGPTPRLGETDVTATVTLWRSLTVTDGAGNLGLTTAASGAGFGAFDIARNFSSASMNVTQAPGAAPAGMDNVNISLSGTSFCNGLTPVPSGDQGFDCATAAPATPNSRTVTITAGGPTGFVTPFTAVHVYRVDARGTVVYLGQAAFVASGSVGTRFEHRWVFTASATGWRGDADPAGTPDGAVTQQIFAVGVTSDRDVFRSPTVAITVEGAHRQPQL